MTPCSSMRPIGLPLLIFLASWPLGCDSRADKKPAADAKDKVPGLPKGHEAPATVVEMSDLKIKRLTPLSAGFEVKYRFTKGQPQPGRKYMCHVKFKGLEIYSNRPHDGKDLKLEGTLQGEIAVLEPDQTALEIWMGELVEDKRYQKISNIVDGPIPGR